MLVEYQDNARTGVTGAPANKLTRLSVEYSLTEHCNISCHACAHASPLLAKKFADLAHFTRDFEALADLANKTGGAFLFANSAEQLIPLYGTVGELLSLSLPTYRLKFTVTADDPNAFVNAVALRGRVTVDTGATTFDVPFIVGVP